MLMDGLLENEKESFDALEIKIILGKFERSKILEIYFARFDGRIPETVPEIYTELYKIELHVIKEYLLGQRPHDPILAKILRLMH